MKNITIIQIAFLLAIGLAACNPASEEFPLGAYVDRNGGVVEFLEDGTYLVSDHVGASEEITPSVWT